MDLLQGPTLKALTSSVEDVLSDRFPTSRLRALHEEGDPHDPELWATGCYLGWQMLSVPEELGGAGGTVVELGLLMESLGRFVASGPWIGTALAATLLAEAGDGTALAAIGSGDARYGIGVPVRAQPKDGKLALRVMDAAGATAFITVDHDAVRTYPLPLPNATHGTVEAFDPADAVRDVAVDAASGAPVAVGPGRARPIGSALVAAAAAGVAARCVDLAVAHATTREQFGKPIGSFQAVKHRCADMAVRREAATASAYYALAGIAGHEPEAESAAASALVVATDAAVQNAEDCVQVYGAMGFTWECDAHLYLKRAHRLRALLRHLLPDRLL